MQATAACPGVIVVDTNMRLVAANADAVQILTFPETMERIPDLENWIANRIRSRLTDPHAAKGRSFISRFKSAKRTYTCRTFSLNLRAGAFAPRSPTTLILLERYAGSVTTLDELAERFGLTPREQETVTLLLQGLTSKEIAHEMKISPNTVKAFIRLVMLKMKVSTRSGIVGKIAEAQNLIHQPALKLPAGRPSHAEVGSCVTLAVPQTEPKPKSGG